MRSHLHIFTYFTHDLGLVSQAHDVTNIKAKLGLKRINVNLGFTELYWIKARLQPWMNSNCLIHSCTQVGGVLWKKKNWTLWNANGFEPTSYTLELESNHVYYMSPLYIRNINTGNKIWQEINFNREYILTGIICWNNAQKSIFFAQKASSYSASVWK